MEEKKVIHAGVTGLLLVIAIIVMAFEGIFIWKMNSENKAKEEEIASLEQRINDLHATNNKLQEKIDEISVIIDATGDSNEANDKLTELKFTKSFISRWHQILGIDLYILEQTGERTYSIVEVSAPLGDPTYMKNEFNVDFSNKSWEINNRDIQGIAGLYSIDEDDLENSPILSNIIIKYVDDTYGTINLLEKNTDVKPIEVDELKKLIENYNDLKQKYNMSDMSL